MQSIKDTTLLLCKAFNKPELVCAVEQGVPCSTALATLAREQRDYKITLDFLALEAKRCEQYSAVVKTLTRPCLVAYNER